MANTVNDLTGKRAGLLTVIRRIGTNKEGRAVWLCRCDCGNEFERISSIIDNAIKNKKHSHCGCSPANKSHGLSKEKHLYWVWASIIQRCENQKNKDYENYGGRGIKICQDWRIDFGEFYLWAKASGYKRGLTIERLDVNKGYNPENCDWTENERQSLNCRRSIMIEYKGKTKHLSDWAREYNLKYKTLRGRLLTYGWDIERALTTRPKGESNA